MLKGYIINLLSHFMLFSTGTLENIPKTKVKKPEVKKKVTSKSKPAPTTTKNSAPNFFQMTSDDWMAVSDEDDDDDRVGVGAFDSTFLNVKFYGGIISLNLISLS